MSFITCLVKSDMVLNNQDTPSDLKNEWNHHQCSSKIKWRESIKKDVDKMNRRFCGKLSIRKNYLTIRRL